MKRILSTLTLALLLCFPTGGFAAYAGHFGDIDSNGDALITWEEFQSFFHDAERDKFDEAAGEDEAIDHDEWHSFKQRHGYTHEEGKGHKG